MFLGIGGTMSKMLALESGLLTQQGSMMMIGSIVGGCVIGEILKLEDLLENFGEWLKKKSRSGGDAGFVHAFVTASLTVCIGAMAVVGSIEDGINLNPSILYAKSVLDFVIVAAMSASMGRGSPSSAWRCSPASSGRCSPRRRSPTSPASAIRSSSAWA